MNHSKSCVPKQTPCSRLSMWAFVRVAALLTLGAFSVMLVIMLLSGDPLLWQFSAVLCLGTIAAIWTITITIGGLVMIPVGLWRFSRQLSRNLPPNAACHGQVWDRWMDGPEVLGP
jgi:hypothetical protein